MGVNSANSGVHQTEVDYMSKVSKTDLEAKNAILKQMGKISLRAFAKSKKVNAGYLSAVINGSHPASNKLRLALGLPPRSVAVEPCAKCGQVHTLKHCPDAPRKYAPHPVMRVTAIKRLLQSPYRDS